MDTTHQLFARAKPDLSSLNTFFFAILKLLSERFSEAKENKSTRNGPKMTRRLKWFINLYSQKSNVISD